MKQDFWVSFTDAWSKTDGKLNKIVVKCSSLQQADEVRKRLIGKMGVKYVFVGIDVPNSEREKFNLVFKKPEEV